MSELRSLSNLWEWEMAEAILKESFWMWEEWFWMSVDYIKENPVSVGLSVGSASLIPLVICSICCRRGSKKKNKDEPKTEKEPSHKEKSIDSDNKESETRSSPKSPGSGSNRKRKPKT